jgi:methionyl-tRNA synthetase
MKKTGAEFTDFVRTTDQHHEAAVQYIWQKLQPHIYKGKYEGWYCVGHEAFFTDKEVEATNGVCPDHQKPYERISEDNYYLKTSAFTDQIREAIEKNRMQIVPEYRKNEFLELIKDGLPDVSVSRPKKSLTWGVPVPDDPEQIIYVWIDALSNYLTVIGYPDDETYKEFWPADIQVVGKDILRFHAGIWPAMLLGLDLPLPKKLLVHGFINVGGAKMSKTVGNVVDPNQIIDEYGLDAFRYFFSRHIPTQDDGDFTWEKFESAYNNELGNDLGNLVSRVASMVTRYQSGVIGDAPQGDHDPKAYFDAMSGLRFDTAIDETWIKVRALNKYIETVKPWEIAKKRETDPDAEGHLGEVLAQAVGSLLQIADQLKPFLPETAETIEKTFASGVIVPLEKQGGLFPKIYQHTSDPRAPKQA